MRNSINLATSPFLPYRRFALTVGLLGALALVLTLVVAVEGVRTWRERTTTQARVRELRAERTRLATAEQRLEAELQDPATQAVLEHTRFLNGLVRQKNLSWTELFFDLQERLPARVRILALSPSLREDGRMQVDLQVGGESGPAVIGFLQALEEGQKFTEVELHSQSHDAGRGADRMVAQVSVVYVQE